MISRELIPLVAETINTRPRDLGLANPTQQIIIKAFRYHLSQKLKTAVEITFVVADSKPATLTLGYVPLQFRETEVCRKAATEVLGMIKERVKTKWHIEGTIAGIPNNGLLLLYDFDQAYEIATNLQIADFATIQFAYTACLHFAAADRMNIDAAKWFDVLCEFSKKCISNGAWRAALLCLDEAENLLYHFFSNFDEEDGSKTELIESLINLGDCFILADLPERAVNLAKKSLPRLEEIDQGEANKAETERLQTRILAWQKASAEIWQENAPLLVIARDFAKKIA